MCIDLWGQMWIEWGSYMEDRAMWTKVWADMGRCGHLWVDAPGLDGCLVDACLEAFIR